MTLFAELSRRNVLRAGAAYVVVAWVIVEVALVLQEIFGFDIWIVRILTILLALGVVPVLVFAWLYELTPEGFKRDAEVNGDRAYANAAGRKLIYVTVGAAFVGVAILGGIWPPPPPPPPPAPELSPPVEEVVYESVAVLPFANLSGNPDDEYFSDGLTETLLHMLAQVKDLKVAARTSSFAFKGRNHDIREIASTLGVAHVLEGSVQRAGETVRVTAQLIAADDGTHLWSGRFDRKLTDIFAIQDEIASQVGIALLARLWNPAHLRSIETKNFLAYDLFLRARAARNREGSEPLRDAERLLRESLAMDPAFLDAKALLADVLILQADNGFRPREESDKDARRLLGEILAENPDHVRARSMLTMMDASMAFASGEFAKVQGLLEQMRKILDAAPNDIEVRKLFARVAGVVGAREEAKVILQRAANIDPLNAEIHFWLATIHLGLGELQQMRDAMQRAVDIEPDNPAFRQILGSVGLTLGDGELAIRSFSQAMQLDPFDEELPGSAAEFLYWLGLPEEARKFHDRVIERAPESEMALELAMLESWTGGDREHALALARDVIRNAPYERWTAWRTAWRLLLFTSVERSTVEEDVRLMDAHLPGFSELDDVGVPPRVSAIRAHAVDVLLATWGQDSIVDYIERASGHWSQLNVRPEDFPDPTLYRLLIMEGPEVAIEWALKEVFSRSVTAVPMWRLQYSRPFLAPVLDDPRIRKAIERWEEQEARIRGEVLQYLASR